MEVYLIRHTTPLIEKGICYGQSEVLLPKSFHIEAQKVLQSLPGLFDAVYSSPAGRCNILARLIKAKGSVITDKRLFELNFGDWEMKKWDEINQSDLNSWMSDFVNARVPNGETFHELNIRVNDFIDELARTDNQKVAIITHAGVIRCFVSRILKSHLQDAFKIPVDYSSITKVILNADYCFCNLEFLNRINHDGRVN